MIYDCFTFFNELDLLEIRLNELKDVVDKFVICESNVTHIGKPKPLYLTDNMERFKDFNIKLVVFEGNENPVNAWDNEKGQRNYLLEGLKNDFSYDDVIVLTDLDEIPSRKAITSYTGGEIISLEMLFSYYFVNNVMSEKWYHGKIFRGNHLLTLSMDNIRLGRTCYCIPNAGNHFSYLGGVDSISEKLSAFAHQEFNNEEFNTKDKIQKCLNDNINLFDGVPKFKTYELEEMSVCPRYLIENKDRYRHFIKEVR